MANTKIWVLANQKGGVGKTTGTMLIADALNKMGFQVLVVDTDPQRSAQKWESLTIDEYPAFPVKVEAVSGLNEVEFAKWLTKRAEGIDYFLIDTPPNLHSKELRAALFIADTVIIPFNAHGTSVDSLEEVIPLIKMVEESRSDSMSIHILLNRIDIRRASERAIVQNASNICPWPILQSQLKNLAAYADAYNYRTSIYSLPGGKEAKDALESVVNEIIQNG
jgi:chromosome partitioning protein